MVGSIVIFLWVIVAQATSAALLGWFFSWVFGMVPRRVKSDKARLGEIMLVSCVSVINISGAMEVSS